jgi:pyoverdine/dityrosine biosynthesis protein Dit1
MCKTCEALRNIGIEEYHVNLNHNGKISIEDLLKAYPTKAKEIVKIFDSTTDKPEEYL